MSKKDEDIDGGWAWFVLIAVYLGIVILYTTTFMSGVLYVAMLEQFDANEAKTSLVGALNGGLLCLLGPIAGIVTITFSCRVCMFIGGVCLTISCVTSAFVENIDELILTYGVIGGIGNCLASTPFVVVLGFYFHERRSMVIAISQAVIGIGFFLASPLAFVMLNRLGLHGTFLILGCINAQLCVIAVICKPSSVEERILNKTYISEGRNYNDNEGHYLDQLSLNTLESVITNQEIVIEDKETFSPNLTDVEIDKRISYTEDDDSYLLNTNEWYTSQTDDDKFDVTMSDILLDKQERNTDNVMEGANNEFYVSQTEDKCRTSVCNGLHNKPERKATNVDICENDSANIDELNTSKPNVNDLDHKQFRVGIMVFKIANRIINLHLLTNVPFVLFILSTLSWNFTLSVCIMHLPNYMKVKGATDMAVSAIMTCFSASNLLGRFLAATTVEKGGIDSQSLLVGMLGVAGTVTILFPFYSGSVGDYVFAALVGLYTGGPFSLMTPITLQLVPLEDLPAAHGLEYFFSGLGLVPGPFVAGLLYNLVGSYEFSFISAGCILLLGFLLALASTAKTAQQKAAG